MDKLAFHTMVKSRCPWAVAPSGGLGAFGAKLRCQGRFAAPKLHLPDSKNDKTEKQNKYTRLFFIHPSRQVVVEDQPLGLRSVQHAPRSTCKTDRMIVVDCNVATTSRRGRGPPQQGQVCGVGPSAIGQRGRFRRQSGSLRFVPPPARGACSPGSRTSRRDATCTNGSTAPRPRASTESWRSTCLSLVPPRKPSLPPGLLARLGKRGTLSFLDHLTCKKLDRLAKAKDVQRNCPSSHNPVFYSWHGSNGNSHGSALPRVLDQGLRLTAIQPSLGWSGLSPLLAPWHHFFSLGWHCQGHPLHPTRAGCLASSDAGEVCAGD